MSDDRTGTTSETTAAQRPIGDGDAAHAVMDYVRRRFWFPGFSYDRTPNGVLRMDATQWEAIRTTLERLYGLNDLSAAFQLTRGREFHALSYDDYVDDDSDDEDDEDEDEYRIVDPHRDPALPNGWITLLEAAYEQLGDIDGLAKLYAYCVLTDLSPDGSGHADTDDDYDEDANDIDEIKRLTYLDKLRNLVGQTTDDNRQTVSERWNHTVEAIVAAFEAADAMEYPVSPAHAYEELLLKERLGDAAWRYCERRVHDPWARSASSIALVERFLDVLAPDHAAEACELMLGPLHDADSELMRDDSTEHQRDIVRTLRRCMPYVGVERIRAEAERLLRLYRRRTELRASLEGFLHDLADPTATVPDATPATE